MKIFEISLIVAFISLMGMIAGELLFLIEVDVAVVDMTIVDTICSYVFVVSIIVTTVYFFVEDNFDPMKTFLLWIGFFFFKIIYYSLIKFVLPEKKLWYNVCGHNTFHDTLNPFAPYSYGGMPRNKFLELYHERKEGIKVTYNEYWRAKWGSVTPSREEYLIINNKENLIRKRFYFRG